MSIKLTTSEFIKRSTEKHGNKYDYSNVEYVNDITKVKIVCKKHGTFQQLPSSHYRSVAGCKECSILNGTNSRRNNLDNILDRFIKKHDNKYDYSDVIYTKMKNKVSIKCKLHDLKFLQSPEKHLDSKTGGCPKCNTIGKGRLTNNIFIEMSNKIHNNRYIYNETIYNGSNKKLKIKCSLHGIFEMTPNSHLNGRGCRICNRNGGIMENIWLDTFNIDKEHRQYKIDNFFVDGIDLTNNIIYEFNGDFWHGNPNIYKSNDVNRVNGIKYGELYKKTIERESLLESIGYKVISIWESDFKKIIKL